MRDPAEPSDCGVSIIRICNLRLVGLENLAGDTTAIPD